MIKLNYVFFFVYNAFLVPYHIVFQLFCFINRLIDPFRLEAYLIIKIPIKVLHFKLKESAQSFVKSFLI